MHAVPTIVQAQAESGETELPVDLLHWVLVLIPIAVLLFLYTVRRWKGPEAGPIGVVLSATIAVTFFQIPFDTLVVAAGKGVWDSIPILFVIFAALLLYRIGTAAGAFHALRHGVEKHTKNRVFLVLAFGWVFASFTQGIAGFGAPIVIVAPILLALGVKPIYAVVIPLIGHIHKVRMSGFHGTHLDQVLRTQGINTLFFTGVNTDQCVTTTMEAAYFNDYNAVLLTDGTATSSPPFCQDAVEHNAEQCWGFTMSTYDFANYTEVRAAPAMEGSG